ncbi:MAG: tryptophan synthase subunit alpha [Synechococcus sp. SB0678_bin_12]|nr:tryptophan synthase subunit alpha [Synechococcus sp. SB0678_bin_12]MYI88673.1 tryptophan synthase subunit alpha [Synechococcus sp. SB0672_bin_10]
MNPSSPEHPENSPISARFATLAQQGRCALMPFLMAGDPDLDTTAACLLALQDQGADLVELGIPYSDPLADGPVIQAAAGRALAAGATCAGVLDMLASLRGQLHMPVVLFTYANPLLNMGVANFCDRAAADAAGLVVPDLPLEEAQRLSPTVAAAGLDMVLLAAPTTSPQRMAQIARTSRGFIYLVSVTGVTGTREQMDQRVASLIGQLKSLAQQPVAVGFGISTAAQARQVRLWGSDGAIVGSAFVKRIAAVGPSDHPALVAGAFCAELRRGLDSCVPAS